MRQVLLICVAIIVAVAAVDLERAHKNKHGQAHAHEHEHKRQRALTAGNEGNQCTGISGNKGTCYVSSTCPNLDVDHTHTCDGVGVVSQTESCNENGCTKITTTCLTGGSGMCCCTQGQKHAGTCLDSVGLHGYCAASCKDGLSCQTSQNDETGEPACGTACCCTSVNTLGTKGGKENDCCGNPTASNQCPGVCDSSCATQNVISGGNRPCFAANLKCCKVGDGTNLGKNSGESCGAGAAGTCQEVACVAPRLITGGDTCASPLTCCGPDPTTAAGIEDGQPCGSGGAGKCQSAACADGKSVAVVPGNPCKPYLSCCAPPDVTLPIADPLPPGGAPDPPSPDPPAPSPPADPQSQPAPTTPTPDPPPATPSDTPAPPT